MRYIEFVKKYEKYDKYILFLISTGKFSVDEIAKIAEVSRPTVYAAMERNKQMIQDLSDV